MTFKHALVRLLNRRILPRWRLVLRKSGHDGDDFIVSEKFRQVLIEDIRDRLLPFVSREARLLPEDAGARLYQMIEDFFRLYRERPVRDNAGGSGFNGSLTLYVLARLLAPRLIVESGTWQGHSAWLLAAACPGAEVHSFDIEHANLLYRDPRVTYHLGDWTGTDLGRPDPAEALVFFDDHVSHAQRLREAATRGYRTLILDDNVPAQALYATGLPPVPTVDMLFDARVKPGDEIEWRYRGRLQRFVCRPADWTAAALVREYHKAPPLADVSFYRPHIGLSLVRLGD